MNSMNGLTRTCWRTTMHPKERRGAPCRPHSPQHLDAGDGNGDRGHHDEREGARPRRRLHAPYSVDLEARRTVSKQQGMSAKLPEAALTRGAGAGSPSRWI